MIAFRLAEVAAVCDGEVVGDPDAEVSVVVTDSRRVDADGALFVALDGEHDDGHRFVAAARDAGAAAALVERREVLGDGPGVVVTSTWSALGRLGAAVRDRVDPDVIAITGSVGKTTTKDLSRAAIGGDRPTVAAEGSFNNELGVPLTLLATQADTRALVVEIGARGPGHIAALAPLVRPDVSIVTAVAGAHLEMFGDLDGVAAAKGELVEALTPDGTAVLNAGDERVWAMRDRTQARVLGYGAGADVVAEDVVVDAWGRSRATVRTPWGRGELALPVPGRHNLDNALAALAAAGAIGVPLATALTGLGGASVSRWRAELHERADGLLVCNDAYNSNPTSALAALDLLDQLRRPTGRTVAVLGHMAELGAAAESGHEQVGAHAGHVADLVVTTGGTFGLGPAARAAGAEVVAVEGPDAAVAALRGRVGPGDVVLVKASRSAGLEAVADGLLADTTPRAPHDEETIP
jgi:UDP-N-acetylmuramoyl-tripeptide--D-alanyl-D-alanine ligase